MRIVSGKYRGRVLNKFKGEAIRPTADNVREALFNVLQTRIYGSSFLDLFCGTGAIGIEALSRGAEYVLFNDISKESVKLTKDNLALLKITENHKVTNLSAETLLATLNQTFNIIFIDPPYEKGITDQVKETVCTKLSDGGVVIIESEQPLDYTVKNMVKTAEKRYGRVYLTFYKREEL